MGFKSIQGFLKFELQLIFSTNLREFARKFKRLAKIRVRKIKSNLGLG